MLNEDKIELMKIFRRYNITHIIKFVAEYLAETTATKSKGVTSVIISNKTYVNTVFKNEFESQLDERV